MPGTNGSSAGEADVVGQADSVEHVIETHALTKRYGKHLAVDQLDLTVPVGSVFGFLGPNGSGKTTTIRMLMGLIEPTSGRAQVLGRPMPRSTRSVLPHVGALIEGPALYGFLSGRDNLLRYDSADPTADPRTRRVRAEVALDRVGLTAAAGKKAKAYSLGMKQRLGLAARSSRAGSSSSTSRRTDSTRRACARSAPWCGSWRRRARPSSSPRTSSTRSSRSARMRP